MKAIRTLIENGLSEKAAMAALTTNPASILGISRMAGTIEKGKMANFVISSDSLFKEDAQIKHVVADGYIFDYEVKKKNRPTETEKLKGRHPQSPGFGNTPLRLLPDLRGRIGHFQRWIGLCWYHHL